MDPSQLKFAETHEWVYLEGDTATIGITDYAVRELKDIVFIDLGNASGSLSQGDTFGEIESTKSVSDLYMPADGVILEVNDTLENNLDQLKDAFGKGWMIKAKLDDPSQLDNLMDLAAYRKKFS